MTKQRGFTLIELMVILAVVATVAAFGVPQIQSIMQNNRVVAALNSLSAHMQYARSEAIKRAADISIMADDPGLINWHQGWIVFIDDDTDGIADPGEEKLRQVDALEIPNVTITGTNRNLTFTADGSTTATFDYIIILSDSKTGTQYTITILSSGKISTKKLQSG